ncbi:MULTISPECIES: hypothetical protein [unclassified Chelatococcus]|uniref:hypothetical protein n=1 Tax=unclassified Chelatococcus TaxID=2638111 RepID=UPI001BCCDF81|nr:MULTISPECIES: hypothetical protein [unclassified Chelatococcus]MBS7698333.1 hypothetical protein [Chelatococcus sp. YT9]MBX3559190.1 hypothetical protein [Chelatococcus sp.]
MTTHTEKNRPAAQSYQARQAERVPTFGSIGIPAVAAAATVTRNTTPRSVDAPRNRSNGQTGSRFAN